MDGGLGSLACYHNDDALQSCLLNQLKAPVYLVPRTEPLGSIFTIESSICQIFVAFWSGGEHRIARSLVLLESEICISTAAVKRNNACSPCCHWAKLYHYAYPKTANHEASIPVFGTKAAVGFSSARCSSAFRPQQRMVLASLKECSHFLEQRPLITSGVICTCSRNPSH